MRTPGPFRAIANHGQMSQKRINRLDNRELVVHDRP